MASSTRASGVGGSRCSGTSEQRRESMDLEGASWLGEKGIWEDPDERVAASEEKEGVGLGLG